MYIYAYIHSPLRFSFISLLCRYSANIELAAFFRLKDTPRFVNDIPNFYFLIRDAKVWQPLTDREDRVLPLEA